jgi:predicted nucleic acid-binding protein
VAGVIVLDAGVVISHLQQEDPFHDAATGFLEEHEEFDWAVSAMTLAECLVQAVRAGRGMQMLHKIERLAILQLDLSASDALTLADTRSTTGLRMPDAIVVHTAQRHGAELATTDRSVARAAEQRGVTAHLLQA